MSYDTVILVDDEEVFSANMTFNISQVYYDHMSPEGISILDGMKCSETADIFSRFWDSIELQRTALWNDNTVGEPTLCKAYDASNGWGPWLVL